MKSIRVQLSEEDFQRIIENGRCTVGSMWSLDERTYEFRPYKIRPVKKHDVLGRKRTKCCVTRIDDDHVKVSISINRHKCADPVEAIYDEIDESAEFVEDYLQAV